MSKLSKIWQDLSANFGFSARMNLLTGQIQFNQVKPRVNLVRRIKDLNPVWEKKSNSSKIIHRIYRYIGDKRQWQKFNLKLDATVILPGLVGQEFYKTTGHYHLILPYLNRPSPDFYQLIFGQGLILLQKEINGQVINYWFRPKILEPVLIPSDFAHTCINLGKTPVVFVNICVRTPHLDYRSIISRHGMAYRLKKDKGRIVFQLNSAYKKWGLKIHPIVKKKFIFKSSWAHQPFYQILQKDLSRFNFLTKPV